MSEKCKRGQRKVLGRCMSEKAILEALKKEAAWGSDCVLEEGQLGYGIRAKVIRGSMRKARSGKCVRPKDLSPIRQQQLLSDIWFKRLGKR